MTWTVSDVMSRPAVTVGPSGSFKSCLDLMRIHEVSALPVVSAEGKLVGLVSEADLMRRFVVGSRGTGGGAPNAGDLMTKDVATVQAGATLAAAARLMVRRGVKHLPVVDGTGQVAGMCSRVDVLRVFLRSDESIRKEVANGLLNEMPLLGRGRVKVEVSDGVVHLHGDVESTALTGLLLRLIAAVPGVVGVENHLQTAQTAAAANHA